MSFNIHVIVVINARRTYMMSNVIRLYLSVHPSISNGSQQKWFDLEKRGHISGYSAFEARAKVVSVSARPGRALATGMNTSFFNRLCKNQSTMGTYIQWPKPLDS